MIFLSDFLVRAFHAAYVLPLPFPHALRLKANYFSLAVKLVLFLSVWQLSQRQKKNFLLFRSLFRMPSRAAGSCALFSFVSVICMHFVLTQNAIFLLTKLFCVSLSFHVSFIEVTLRPRRPYLQIDFLHNLSHVFQPQDPPELRF